VIGKKTIWAGMYDKAEDRNEQEKQFMHSQNKLKRILILSIGTNDAVLNRYLFFVFNDDPGFGWEFYLMHESRPSCQTP